MQCRVHAAQLGRLKDAFQAAGTRVMIILGGTVERARAYAQLLSLPYPVLADPQREVYAAYGLDKVLFIQRTAALIIDRAGIIRYVRRATNPNAWLQEANELLDAAQKINTRGVE